MGFESFRVELCGGPATFAEADAAVRAVPHARPDPGALALAGSTYYAIDDGTHVIEVAVSDAPANISCRFTLSHPPTVDAAFLTLTCSLAQRLGMVAWVCDDTPVGVEGGPFAAGQFATFAAAVAACLTVRRAEWVEMFGPETLAGTSPEVYERIIRPHCVPVTA